MKKKQKAGKQPGYYQQGYVALRISMQESDPSEFEVQVLGVTLTIVNALLLTRNKTMAWIDPVEIWMGDSIEEALKEIKMEEEGGET